MRVTCKLYYHDHIKLQSKCSYDFLNRIKRWIPRRRERFVGAIARDAGFSGKLRHSLCAGNVAEGGGDHGGVVVFKRSIQVGGSG